MVSLIGKAGPVGGRCGLSEHQLQQACAVANRREYSQASSATSLPAIGIETANRPHVGGNILDAIKLVKHHHSFPRQPAPEDEFGRLTALYGKATI
jgi:hypothetical protein